MTMFWRKQRKICEHFYEFERSGRHHFAKVKEALSRKDWYDKWGKVCTVNFAAKTQSQCSMLSWHDVICLMFDRSIIFHHWRWLTLVSSATTLKIPASR